MENVSNETNKSNEEMVQIINKLSELQLVTSTSTSGFTATIGNRYIVAYTRVGETNISMSGATKIWGWTYGKTSGSGSKGALYFALLEATSDSINFSGSKNILAYVEVDKSIDLSKLQPTTSTSTSGFTATVGKRYIVAYTRLSQTSISMSGATKIWGWAYGKTSGNGSKVGLYFGLLEATSDRINFSGYDNILAYIELDRLTDE